MGSYNDTVTAQEQTFDGSNPPSDTRPERDLMLTQVRARLPQRLSESHGCHANCVDASRRGA